MYKFSKKENKTANRLFALAAAYIVLNALHSMDWYGVFEKAASRDFEYFSAIVNTADIGILIIRSIVTLLIFQFIKKLRETDVTKKLYGIVFWIMTAYTVFSYLYMGLFYFSNSLFPGFLQSVRDKPQLMAGVNFIYLYSGIFLPLPFYIAIIIKEKLDINWMIIGSLANMYLFLLEKILYAMRDKVRLMADFSFEQRFPFISVYINYDALVAIRGYFWIIGLIVLIIIYKKKFANIKAKEEI